VEPYWILFGLVVAAGVVRLAVDVIGRVWEAP